jgi:hypothetical protein
MASLPRKSGYLDEEVVDLADRIQELLLEIQWLHDIVFACSL